MYSTVARGRIRTKSHDHYCTIVLHTPQHMYRQHRCLPLSFIWATKRDLFGDETVHSDRHVSQIFTVSTVRYLVVR